MSFDNMAPWDAFSWFDTPVYLTLGALGTNADVLPADPRRVLIIFSLQSQGSTPPAGIMLATKPLDNTQEGIALTQYAPILILTHEQHGPLVQVAWYGMSVGSTERLTVITVKLRDYPRAQRGVDYGFRLPPNARSALRPGGRERYGPSWAKSAAQNDHRQRPPDE